jgi:hypothetical protein
LTATVLKKQECGRDSSRNERSGNQRQPEQQVQRNGATDNLSQIGCHGNQLGLNPVADSGQPVIPPSHQAWQRLSGKPTDLRRQVLHETGHQSRSDKHPQQQVAEGRACLGVGRHIAGIHVRDRGNESGPEQSGALQ